MYEHFRIREVWRLIEDIKFFSSVFTLVDSVFIL